MLENITFVVHTIVPEKYRVWKSNLPGPCSHPVAVCTCPLGSILVLDYDFTSCSTRLLRIRLHQPADVFEEKKGYKDARDMCFSKGVGFVIERGNKTIRFIDMIGSVRLNANSLRSRTELDSKLRAYKLSLGGTVPTLRQRLAQHLEQIAGKITHLDHVQIVPPLRNPSAICVASDEVLLCADDDQRAIFQVTLEKGGVTIRGKSLKLVDYQADVSLIESLAVCGRVAYFVAAKCPRTVGGVYSFNLEGGPVDIVLKNETTFCSEIKKSCTL